MPAVFLAFFFAWPLLTVLSRGLSLDGLDVLSSASTWRVVAVHVVQAVLSTVATLVVGLPAAYALHRLDVPRTARAAVAADRAVRAADGGGGHGVPRAAARGMGRNARRDRAGARVLQPRHRGARGRRAVGAPRRPLRDGRRARSVPSPLRVLRTVTWPLLRPAVLAASALVFLFTFTSFGVIARARRPDHDHARGRDLPPHGAAVRPSGRGDSRGAAAGRGPAACWWLPGGCSAGSPCGSGWRGADVAACACRGRPSTGRRRRDASCSVRWSRRRCSRSLRDSLRVGDAMGPRLVGRARRPTARARATSLRGSRCASRSRTPSSLC